MTRISHKSERDSAHSEVKTTREQLEDLIKTINEVATKVARKESKVETNQTKIDDIKMKSILRGSVV